MTATLRRRADNALLRWQARLDSPWADRVLPWAAATALFVVLALLALARQRSVDAPAQLATALQSTWLLGDGGTDLTVDGGVHVLARHLSLALAPLGLVTRVLSRTTTLLVVQAAGLAVAVVPLWRLARRVATLRVGAAATLVLAYACYPAVHGVNLSGFHVEALALPLLLLGAWAGFEGRNVLLGAAMAGVLLLRADLGLAVAGLGLVLALNDRRRSGVACIGAGLTWTAVATLVVQPLLDAGNVHVSPYAAFGDSPLSVLVGMVGDPGEVAGQLVADRNMDLLVVLLGPLLFLPVLVPRFLAGIVPIGLASLVAAGPDDLLLTGRTVPLTAFLFLATTFALHRLGRLGVERVTVDRRLLIALALASVVFFIQAGTASPLRRPWDWGGRDLADQARVAAAEVPDPEDTVRAAVTVLPLVAERAGVWRWDPGDRPDPRAAGREVDVVIVDEAVLDGWSVLDRRLLADGLVAEGFDPVFSEEGVTVYRRSGSP